MSDSAQTTADPEADTKTDADQQAATDSAPVTDGSSSIVRALENAGVEHAFGVQGGAIMPVYDALWDSDIEHVTMAHEQGASHAADAYGVVAGSPGIALATSGPGATNLVTGIADANMDSDAMVALTGQVPSDMVGSDAFQETDTTGVTMPITKHNWFAASADSIGDTVGEAFALAESGRPGPTLVDLPKDVSFEETDVEPGERDPGDCRRWRPRPLAVARWPWAGACRWVGGRAADYVRRWRHRCPRELDVADQPRRAAP